MSDARDMLVDTAERLFADLAAARGQDPAAAWETIEGAGFPLLLAAEDEGGFGGDWGDAVAVFRQAGRHALAAPLVEAVLARWAQGRGGLPDFAGASAIAPRLEGVAADGGFTGYALGVALPPNATAVLGELDGRTIRLPVQAAAIERSANLVGEERAILRFEAAPFEAGAQAPGLFAFGALARAAQIAGALDAALALSIEHANTRTQFGRPIGKFQALQQNLAIFAEEAAAVNCAVQAAAEAADRGDADFEIACAKLRANQAAGRATPIAHQVHGAIGFTREHDLPRFTLRLNAWRTEYGAERFWASMLGNRTLALGGEGLWAELTRRSDAP
jgi:acyl-CoA dehydrogenase